MAVAFLEAGLALILTAGCASPPADRGREPARVLPAAPVPAPVPQPEPVAPEPAPTAPPAAAGTVPVVKVTDGDTIKVSINGRTETVRLIGVFSWVPALGMREPRVFAGI